MAFPFPGAGFLELEASVIIETKFWSIEELGSFAGFFRWGFGATLIIERRKLGAPLEAWGVCCRTSCGRRCCGWEWRPGAWITETWARWRLCHGASTASRPLTACGNPCGSRTFPRMAQNWEPRWISSRCGNWRKGRRGGIGRRTK